MKLKKCYLSMNNIMKNFLPIWMLVIFSNAMAQDGYYCSPVATSHVHFVKERSDYVVSQANKDNDVIALRKTKNGWELKLLSEKNWSACASVKNSEFYVSCDLDNNGQFKMDLSTKRYISTFLGSYIVSFSEGVAPPSITLGQCLSDQR